MNGKSDRILVGLAVLISVALTAITISAVLRQSETLREREYAALRESASRAATERAATFRSDLNRLFGAATQALRDGGLDALDERLSRESEWPVYFLEDAVNRWIALPLSPSQFPPEFPQTDELIASNELEFGEQDLTGALERLDRLGERADDARVRCAARLAAAGVRRKLGSLQAAARGYRDAIPLLEAQPTLIRWTFWTRLAAISCWSEAGQTSNARDALLQLALSMRNAHPGRYSSADVTMFRSRLEWLRARSPTLTATLDEQATDAQTDDLLRDLDGNATRRDLLAALSSEMRRVLAKRPDENSSAVSFVSMHADERTSIVVALRSISPNRRMAVAVPTRDLINRYWNPAAQDAGWRVATPGESVPTESIYALGEAFGGALLEPTTTTREALAASETRRLTLFIGVTTGTAIAWAVVLWMLARAVARQRELVMLQRRFVADVSHELKTPLALIRLLTETLIDGRVSDPARVHQYLTTVERESERLTNLLDSILDFSRIESGRREYNIRDCDPTMVARQAWSLFEPQFHADGFTAQLDVAERLPQIQADAEALQQLIVNLLQNAHRYAGESRFVRLALAAEPESIRIIVEDRGIGMTRAQINRLGDSFYRANDPRVRQTRGTGLGLAIAQHIVAAHRGRIDVDSRPGRGTIFTVHLPIGKSSSQSAAGES